MLYQQVSYRFSLIARTDFGKENLRKKLLKPDSVLRFIAISISLTFFKGSNGLKEVKVGEVSSRTCVNKVFFEILDGLDDADELKIVEVFGGNKESLNGAER